MMDFDQGKLYEFNNLYHYKVIDGFLRIIQIAECALEEEGEIYVHSQFCCEISYFISGKGTVLSGNSEHEVSSGDMHIISRGKNHGIRCDKNEKLRFVCIGFEFLKNTPEKYRILHEYYDGDISIFTKDENKLDELFGMLINELYHTSDDSEMSMLSLIMLILLNARRSAVGEAVKHINFEEMGIKIGTTAYKIIKYVDNNIMKINSLNDISRAVSFSESYISHLFKLKTGETVKNYIKRKKFEKAAEMLKTGEYSVNKLAEIFGYESSQSFGKSFKKYTGMTPLEYKKQFWTL